MHAYEASDAPPPRTPLLGPVLPSGMRAVRAPGSGLRACDAGLAVVATGIARFLHGCRLVSGLLPVQGCVAWTGPRI